MANKINIFENFYDLTIEILTESSRTTSTIETGSLECTWSNTSFKK